MNTKVYDIKAKIKSLQVLEKKIEAEMKRNLKEHSVKSKAQSRMLNEYKLKELRKAIEEEEFLLYEA